MTRTPVEIAAEGMREFDGKCLPPWSVVVKVAISALEREGFVVVPREPTDEMLSAAHRNNHPRDIDTWRTMIAASSSPKAGGAE